MVPRASDAHIRERAARIYRVRFRRVDRSGFIFRGAVFCVEKMVAIAGDIDHCCSGRHAAERVGEDSCASASPFR